MLIDIYSKLLMKGVYLTLFSVYSVPLGCKSMSNASHYIRVFNMLCFVMVWFQSVSPTATRLIGIGIPIINLRWSSDLLRFMMWIPIPVKRHYFSALRSWRILVSTSQNSTSCKWKSYNTIDNDTTLMHREKHYTILNTNRQWCNGE